MSWLGSFCAGAATAVLMGGLGMVVLVHRSTDPPVLAPAVPLRIALVAVGPRDAPAPESWQATTAPLGASLETIGLAALAKPGAPEFDAVILCDAASLGDDSMRVLTGLLERGVGTVLDSCPEGATGAAKGRTLFARLAAAGGSVRAAGAAGARRGRFGPGPVAGVEPAAGPVGRRGALRWAVSRPEVELEGIAQDDPAAAPLATLQHLAPGRLTLELRNPGERRVEDFSARVWLPVGSGWPVAEATGLLAPDPVVRVAADRSWVDLAVPGLAGGTSARYAIRYEPPLVGGSSSAWGRVAGSEQVRPRHR